MSRPRSPRTPSTRRWGHRTARESMKRPRVLRPADHSLCRRGKAAPAASKQGAKPDLQARQRAHTLRTQGRRTRPDWAGAARASQCGEQRGVSRRRRQAVRAPASADDEHLCLWELLPPDSAVHRRRNRERCAVQQASKDAAGPLRGRAGRGGVATGIGGGCGCVGTRNRGAEATTTRRTDTTPRTHPLVHARYPQTSHRLRSRVVRFVAR